MQTRDERRLKAEFERLNRLAGRNIIRIRSHDRVFFAEYDIDLAVTGPHVPGARADDREARLCNVFRLLITLPQQYPAVPASVVVPAGSPAPFVPHFTPEDGAGQSEWRDPMQHDPNEGLDTLIERIGRTIALEENHIFAEQAANTRAKHWLKTPEGRRARQLSRFPGDPMALGATPPPARLANSGMPDPAPVGGTTPAPERVPEPSNEPRLPSAARRKAFAIIEEAPRMEFPTAPPPTGTVILHTTGPVRTAPRLFIRKAAMRRIFEHISWQQRTKTNVVEQGGLLLGRVSRDPDSGLPYAEVLATVEARASRASSGYLEMNHATWKGMLDQIDRSVADGTIPAGLLVVGWYHTHPNGLGVFMSGTDRATQRSLFHEAWQFAIVLNPHRELWEAFAGAECRECAAVVFEPPSEGLAP